MTNYFWGPNDASIQFCEDKYTHIFWIAEYYNTISSLSYIIVGSLNRSKISIGIIFVGIGSILLHGTLRWYGQWIDEIAMLSTITYGIEKYRPDKVKRYYLPIVIFFYIIFLHKYFIFLLSIFGLLNFYLCHITKNKLYITFSTIGFICWISDKLLCNYVKQLYLHLWWHILTSFGMLTLLFDSYPNLHLT
jgi:dihydroceramidase